MGLEHRKLSAAIGLPATSPGLGPRGGPPIPTAMPSCRLMAPGLRGSSGGGGVPRHKLAWSRGGGDPKSLAHSFYRRAAARLDSMCTTWPGCCHVPSRQLHPSNPPEVPEYVPAYLPTQLGKKKGDLFLVVVRKGGGEGDGQPSFTKENCPDPKKISCAPATRTVLDLHCPSLSSSPTPLSVSHACFASHPKLRAVPSKPLLFTKRSVPLNSFHNG